MAKTRLQEKYVSEVVNGLVDKFQYKNVMEIPKIEKIIINMGIGEAVANSKALDAAVSELITIAGQKPVVTKAKNSIAAIKLRAGLPIGSAVDGRGNYALGRKEQLIFPDFEYDKVDKVHGMDIIIVTTAKTDEEARELLRLLGMPFAA